MGTRGSTSEVPRVSCLQTQAQLSVSVFALVLTAVLPNGHKRTVRTVRARFHMGNR